MTLKANQGKKFTAVQELCAATWFSRSPLHRPVHDEFDDGHRRLVRRRVFVCPDAARLEPLRDWPGLQTVLAVETIRHVNGSGKTETDIRYFLSSSADHPEILATAIRRHWPIENSLHWVLDVAFQEDHCRMRDRNAVQNFSLLRKIAINCQSARKRGSSAFSVQAGDGSRGKGHIKDSCFLPVTHPVFKIAVVAGPVRSDG